MNIGAVVVGFNHWHYTDVRDGRYTQDFVHGLQRANPSMHVIVIDNASDPKHPYKSDEVEIIRLEERVGYGPALNVGLKALGKRDLYITFNNDCQMKADGNIQRIASLFDVNTLYGSGWNPDTRLKIFWQSSAWLCISEKIFQAVGYFDEELEAAFEDFDYEYRAMQKGFLLETAYLPVEHLDMHSRYEDDRYPKRWEASRLYFEQKHKLEMERWYKNV